VESSPINTPTSSEPSHQAGWRRGLALGRRWIWRGLKLFGLFLALYVLLTLLGLFPRNRDFVETPSGVPIYVISNGAHTDLAVPVVNAQQDWRKHLDFSEFLEPTAGAQYLTFGWGDRTFYLETQTWADLKVGTALKSTFLPSPTLMHVGIRYGEPTDENGSLKLRRLEISPAQYQRLVEHIESGFARAEDDATILIDCCRYDYENDNFYEGAGRYHLFNSCNNWANNGLKRAGVRTPTWSPFSQPILWALK